MSFKQIKHKRSSDEGKTKFGLAMDSYLNMQMLGIQLKNSIKTERGESGRRVKKSDSDFFFG